MQESYQISVSIPVIKQYSVKRTAFRDKSIYTDNVDWLANWFYNNINPYADNILIETIGEFHQTFPNPPHLSVKFKSDNLWSQVYHMSVDQNGFIYSQNLASHQPQGKSKKGKGKSKKSKGKSKKSKSKSKSRKIR